MTCTLACLARLPSFDLKSIWTVAANMTRSATAPKPTANSVFPADNVRIQPITSRLAVASVANNVRLVAVVSGEFVDIWVLPGIGVNVLLDVWALPVVHILGLDA